ncbi:protein kinase [Rhodococcus pseudokoreensis]|uniref:Serine/threonine-protein kinase PknK n=1 Tax=Rhodococcus pseudokoreensis TaxID=2811421 RepID=A0A974W201_9NOCA|nr:serine/threonine-protein kinase [Rhodococcus pseudokoreensis]QSE89820.1 protein kinase [Rhodococcus pseudokoreensis]
MAEYDPTATQRDLTPGIAAELAAAGFDDAQEIGRGGFGVVYRCLQPSLDRIVAVKVLTADLDQDNVERFIREQRAMGRLSGHPNIANILQVGATASGQPYLVMHLHAHGSLASRIHRSGPIGWDEAVRLGVKVAGALETAHRIGTVHRDVKPANILLTDYGEPQLTDFGIARIAGGFETSTRAVVGSPAFTAPEVLEGGPPTPASDVYGLGATLFCAITGHAAFERRSGEQVVAQFLRITSQPIPDMRGADIPDDVCAAIERAMSRDPASRAATAIEFGEQLREAELRNGLPVDEMALPADLGTRPPTEHRRASLRTASGGTDLMTTGGRHYAVTTGPPPAPSTRFRPPTPTRQLVERRHLLDTLRAGQRRRLTVIHAPAGFGKSTLAAQWGDVLTGEGVSVAWLTVDHDDNNVVWFLSHLVEAIRRVRSTLARNLVQALEEHGDEAEQYVLSSLINEIHARDERVVVVIDDWHRVTDATTRGALGFLLDNGCHHIQVVVASRTRAGLPMSRMRVRDELVEIDYTALRFDDNEARSFLVDLGGLDLDIEDVTDLRDSTDGWVAALQLAYLSLRGRDDPAELIGHLSGRHHAIGEFLAENVLDTLEPEILDFLLTTSVTERISGSLAAALAQVPRGQALLEVVEERDLFLRRVDEDGVWFRYNHVFAEFLRRRLERDHPERIDELHRTASAWFADHELLGEAVDHALLAGDQVRAVELVERDGMHLIEYSHMTTLLGMVAKLPPALTESRPWLQLAVAWANIMLHRALPAQRALDLVESTLDRVPSTDEIADLRVEVAVMRGVIRFRADRMDGANELVQACLPRLDTLRPWVVSSAANIATYRATYQFDFSEARRLQEWASEFHARTNGPYLVMHGHCFAGLAAFEQLDVVAAERSFRAGVRVARRLGGKHSEAARLADSLLGALLYERGEIDQAESLLDEGYELGGEGGLVEFKIPRYVLGARIKALRGDRIAAAQRLDEGARIAVTLSLPRLRANVENERVRLGLPLSSDIPVSPPTQHSSRRRPVDGIEALTAQIEEATAIRLLLDERSPDQAELACTWAQEWANRLEGRGAHRLLMQARRLLVACLAASGRIDEAKELLASIAAQCAELGLIRHLPDGGPHIVSLIAALREDQVAGKWCSDWTHVPAAFLVNMAKASSPQRL